MHNNEEATHAKMTAILTEVVAPAIAGWRILRTSPLTPREQVAGRWFLGDDVLEGQKTMFVELYAVAYSPDNSYKSYFGSMTRERAAQVFAPELAKIKNWRCDYG